MKVGGNSLRQPAFALILLLATPKTGAAQDAPSRPAPGSYGVEETWTSRDKLYHFGISPVGAGASYTAARKLGMRRWPAVAVSAGLMGAVGVVRELQDHRRADKYFSEKDLLWNTAGITIGIWIPDRLLLHRDDEKPPPWMGGFFGWAARSWWTAIGGAPTVGSRLEPLLPLDASRAPDLSPGRRTPSTCRSPPPGSCGPGRRER